MTTLEQRIIEILRWDVAQYDAEIKQLEERLADVIRMRDASVLALAEYERKHNEGDA